MIVAGLLNIMLLIIKNIFSTMNISSADLVKIQLRRSRPVGYSCLTSVLMTSSVSTRVNKANKQTQHFQGFFFSNLLWVELFKLSAQNKAGDTDAGHVWRSGKQKGSRSKIMEIAKEKCKRKGHDVSGGLEDVQTLSFAVKVQTRHV